MKCPRCGSNNRERIRFCEECGAKFELECPDCKAKIPLGKKFCGECGFDLSKSTKSAFLETNEHESRISESPSEETTPTPIPADGERKHVTVLFSDLSGYTEMSEKLDPEEVKEITGRIFGEISNIVGKYDGFIEKYAGDAVMAIFGVPKVHEDDAIRAIKAGRETHKVVEDISAEQEEKIGFPLSMHTGIATGLVVTGQINFERGTHGVSGEALNIASRLSSLATPEEILVDTETFRRAEEHIKFEKLQSVSVKGKTEKVQPYKYVSEREAPLTHQLSHIKADLIGRNVELLQLNEGFQQLLVGKGTVFLIHGDAGTGKSRLIEEFKQKLDQTQIQWHEGHAYPYSKNMPYFPIINLFNQALNIQEGNSPHEIEKKIKSFVENMEGGRVSIAHYIGSLYGLNYTEVESSGPQDRRTRLLRSIQSVFFSLSQIGPTVFVLEDLHWFDPSTLTVIRKMLTQIRIPAMFLCTHRLPFALFGGQLITKIKNPLKEIHIRQLSSSETQLMMKSLLNAENLPQSLFDFILSRLEGNPFFLEEVIKSLIESKTLIRENGHWKLTKPIDDSHVPSTIHGVIAARIDNLELEMKQILQEASLIGRHFLYKILNRITKYENKLDSCLHGLEQIDLIKTKSLIPELEYLFKHALTQEVVYDGILKKKRQALHESIAQVIEQLFQERIPEFYETLAFHYKNSLSLDKALDYLLKSGDKSLRNYALEESHQYYKEAFSLLADKQNRTEIEDCTLIDIIVQWGLVFCYQGDFRQLSEILNLYKRIVENLGNSNRKGMFYAWLGWTYFHRGNPKKAYDYLNSALKIGEEIEDRQIIAYTNIWLGLSCAEMGLFDEGLNHAKIGQKLSREIDLNYETDYYAIHISLNVEAYINFSLGKWQNVLESGENILEFGLEHHCIRSEVTGYFYIGIAKLLTGQPALAIENFYKVSNKAVDPFYINLGKTYLALGYIMSEQPQKSEDMLEEVSDFCNTYDEAFIGAPASLFYGLVLSAKGQISQGIDVLETARKEFEVNHRKFFLSFAEFMIGATILKLVINPNFNSIIKNDIGKDKILNYMSLENAKEHLITSIEISKEIGSLFVSAQGYLSLGHIYAVEKNLNEAKKCFDEAVTAFDTCELEALSNQAKDALSSVAAI
jgi:class 3 adenylate cyclase/tetratricopeptide (TPR) repeat protein